MMRCGAPMEGLSAEDLKSCFSDSKWMRWSWKTNRINWLPQTPELSTKLLDLRLSWSSVSFMLGPEWEVREDRSHSNEKSIVPTENTTVLIETLETPLHHYCLSHQWLHNLHGILPANLTKGNWFTLDEQNKRLNIFMKQCQSRNACKENAMPGKKKLPVQECLQVHSEASKSRRANLAAYGELSYTRQPSVVWTVWTVWVLLMSAIRG